MTDYSFCGIISSTAKGKTYHTYKTISGKRGDKNKVTINEDYKKGVCQCRSCNNVFHQSEIKHKYIEQLGQLSYNRTCPYCGNTHFGLIDYPVSEYELIYKNSKFYGLSNKRIKYIEQYEEFKEVIDELFI